MANNMARGLDSRAGQCLFSPHPPALRPCPLAALLPQRLQPHLARIAASPSAEILSSKSSGPAGGRSVPGD